LPVAISDVPVSHAAQATLRRSTQRTFRHDSRGASERTSSHHGPSGCGSSAYWAGEDARMMGLAAGTRIWIVAGVTDMRRGFGLRSADSLTWTADTIGCGECQFELESGGKSFAEILKPFLSK
jgi:hypothetical protein